MFFESVAAKKLSLGTKGPKHYDVFAIGMMFVTGNWAFSD